MKKEYMLHKVFALFVMSVLVLSAPAVLAQDMDPSSGEEEQGIPEDLPDEAQELPDDNESNSSNESQGDSERPNRTRPDARGPGNGVANERVREAFERSAQRREKVVERLRNVNPEVAEKVESIFKRVSENHSVVLERLNNSKVEALLEDENEDDLEDMMELPSRVLNRYSPEELRDPSVRESLAERGRELKELEDRNFTSRGNSQRASENERQQGQENREEAQRGRQEAQKNREEAQQRAREAREKAQERRNDLVETREKFQERRDEVLSCTEDPEEDCAETAQISREHIVSALEYLSSNLEETIARLESSDYVTEEEEEKHISVLEDRLSNTTDLISSVTAADDFSEIADIGREANTLSSKIRSDLQSARNEMSASTINGIVAQTTALQRKLDLLVVNLESLDVNVSDIDSKIDEFSNHIETARGYEESMNELVNNNITGPERGEAMREASEYRRNAIEEIRNARDVLKDVFSDARSLAKEADVPFEEIMGND